MTEDEGPLDPIAAAAAERLAAEPMAGTLHELLAELASADAAVSSRPLGATIDYVAAGIVFAAVEGRTASFRLRPEIVAAAIRTDGARLGSRGREWVSFTPLRFDRFARDRAVAWFELARRLAGDRR